VDQDDWRAFALLNKIDVFFSCGGIAHSVWQARAARLCR
jgi:hypothetical protein